MQRNWIFPFASILAWQASGVWAGDEVPAISRPMSLAAIVASAEAPPPEIHTPNLQAISQAGDLPQESFSFVNQLQEKEQPQPGDQAAKPMPPALAATAPVASGNDTWLEAVPAWERLYGGVEWMIWWFKGANLPVLATSDNLLLGVPTPGALNSPGTAVLIGGSTSTPDHHGPRFTLGYWLDDERSLALEANFFYLANRSDTQGHLTPGGVVGTPTIFRPFFDVSAGAPSAVLVAGLATPGAMSVELMQRMLGAEANLRRPLAYGANWRLDMLGGFRWLAVDENIEIRTASFGSGPLIPTLAVAESFNTRNRIYGLQLGAETGYQRAAWSVTLLTKLALGVAEQQATVDGTSQFYDSVTGTPGLGGPATLLAQGTNIGTYRRHKFAYVPEIGVTLGYRLLENVSLSLSYSWLYMSAVTRAHDAIDTNTTVPTLVAPPASLTAPAFTFRDTDFWAHGLSFGVAISY